MNIQSMQNEGANALQARAINPNPVNQNNQGNTANTENRAVQGDTYTPTADIENRAPATPNPPAPGNITNEMANEPPEENPVQGERAPTRENPIAAAPENGNNPEPPTAGENRNERPAANTVQNQGEPNRNRMLDLIA